MQSRIASSKNYKNQLSLSFSLPENSFMISGKFGSFGNPKRNCNNAPGYYSNPYLHLSMREENPAC